MTLNLCLCKGTLKRVMISFHSLLRICNFEMLLSINKSRLSARFPLAVPESAPITCLSLLGYVVVFAFIHLISLQEYETV